MASVRAPRQRGRQLGRVDHWVADQWYGFIKPDGNGQQLYVHANSVRDGSSLAVGQRVSFKLRPNERNKYDEAIEVEVLAERLGAHNFLRTSTVTVTKRTHTTADGQVKTVRTTTVHEARGGGGGNATTTAQALQRGGHHDRTPRGKGPGAGGGRKPGSKVVVAPKPATRHGGGSNKKDVLCHFHRTGNCRNGASCPYRHA